MMIPFDKYSTKIFAQIPALFYIKFVVKCEPNIVYYIMTN